MRIFTIFILLFLLSGCYTDGPRDFVYAKDDFWVEGFRNNSLPSKTLYEDKIYCTSINIGNFLKNYLYCLNLKTGKVDWSAEVANWANQSPIVKDSFIYFCSYLGDVYKFDKKGICLWKLKVENSSRGIAINPGTNNLFVRGLSRGIYEYSFLDGSMVNIYGKNSTNISLPVFTKNLMFISGLEGYVSNKFSTNYLFCFDAISKKERWKINIGGSNQGLFLDSNRLYSISTSPTTINCIDVDSGKPIWKHSYYFIGAEPTLIFEKGIIFYYEFDLRNIQELNKFTGDVIKNSDYFKIRSNGLMSPHHYNYKITAEQKKYSVLVTDSLEMPEKFGQEFNIYVKANK